ncbi:hypothetical protein [Natrinema altunense]|uniref:Uncharacterized protein n=1 Tax=Natrinema altunense (strain JCM 12890 / CGMCC 1.3731 / AJ2) TaxID=1227494 RepID=L9ZD28_NATA2|nr:hypothetical protein [Natrinema altunense]ELY84304.1 hypothetical protein C485_15591 [Natrinema altunense JCM 12890]
MSDHSRRSRRTVLRTIGALSTGAVTAVTTAGATTGTSADRPEHASTPRRGRPGSRGPASSADGEIGDLLDGTDLYIGVVDRIVDGEHVVLLLEDGESVVDQLVLPVDRFATIAPDDILLTAATDGELHAYRRVPSKPNGCPDPDFPRLPSDG